MILGYNVIDTILFSEPLPVIKQRLRSARKDFFESSDRIIIDQDIEDRYPYVDSPGVKLIEIQKIINDVDISNCFILLRTCNHDIQNEINFITKFYSVDPIPINFLIINGAYKKDTLKYQNTACQKLWNHLYIGTDGNVNPCCIADHRFPLGNVHQEDIDSIIYSKKSKQLRKWMMQGYRSIACSTCYLKEDSAIKSAREICDPLTQTVNIDYLDIRINNICNFKCRMCSEYFSSAIQQETVEIYGRDAKLGLEQISLDRFSTSERTEFFKKIVPYITTGLKKIYFAGGEPLLAIEHYQILDELLKIGNTNLEIYYNTNLSKLKYKNLNATDRWCQFKNVTVGASIDASDAVAEYVRHGTIWSDIVSNIHFIKKHAPHVKLQITSTVSSLTIENLISLQNTWIDNQLFCVDDFYVQVLVAPNFLSPAALPQHHKQRLGNIIQNHIQRFEGTRLAKQWNDVLQWMNNNDYTFALNEFSRRTQVLDAHRSESFETIFPEYKDLL